VPRAASTESRRVSRLGQGDADVFAAIRTAGDVSATGVGSAVACRVGGAWFSGWGRGPERFPIDRLVGVRCGHGHSPRCDGAQPSGQLVGFVGEEAGVGKGQLPWGVVTEPPMTSQLSLYVSPVTVGNW
jgi:hypothetical protein